ncbi:MAG: hypothetical protein KAT57_08790 [Candidatus Lokiarchaeota archaeon]|nr:hypothetical protein [Candidatus Lokiarchaeota archaeon]
MFSEFNKKRKGKKEKSAKKSESSESKIDNSVILKKNTIVENGEKKIIRVTKEGRVVAKYEEMQKKPETAKLKTIVIEQDDELEIALSDFEDNKDIMIPLNIKEQIERIILKILYEEKSVKSLKILIEKVLEKTIKEKITISEKPINLIIYQLNKDQKIQFTQRDGWKIRI